MLGTAKQPKQGNIMATIQDTFDGTTAAFNLDDEQGTYNLKYNIKTKKWNGVLLGFDYEKDDWTDERELTGEEIKALAIKHSLVIAK